MPDHTDTQKNIFITRHATQELLRNAFNALPSSTCGLLGGKNSVIGTVYPFDHNHHANPFALTRHIQSLESNGMDILSLYISSAVHDERVDFLRGKVIHMCPVINADERSLLRDLPLVIVRLDTKGRMEIVLLEKGDKTKMPILLQEDGQIVDKE